jgi:hypothetical protein
MPPKEKLFDCAAGSLFAIATGYAVPAFINVMQLQLNWVRDLKTCEVIGPEKVYASERIWLSKSTMA